MSAWSASTIRRTVGFSLALAVGLLDASAAHARNVHRSLFYRETPFGSLAWIRDAHTRASARTKYTIEDLSTENCMNLPTTGAQWFAINHRDDDLAGQVGYFSIRILYEFDPGPTSPESRTGIHLQRNGNWFDDSGKQVQNGYERDAEQISLAPERFVDLHHPDEGGETKSLAELVKTIGIWHSKPTADSESSWADRHLYGPRLRAYMRGPSTAISARLIRFTVTDSTSSSEPVVFWLEPRGATSATILVDAPRQEYVGSRRVYTVFFNGLCPG